MEKKEAYSDKRIDSFVKLTADIIVAASGKKENTLVIWPFPPTVSRVLYWGGDYLKDLYEILIRLSEKYSNDEIAKLFYSSARLSNFLWNFESISTTPQTLTGTGNLL